MAGENRPDATNAAASSSSIRHTVVVPGNPPAVFDLFTNGLGDWWPIAYTFSGPEFADATVERHQGGRWLERDRARRVLAWGTVRTFEAATRLVLSFAIGADRKPVSEEHASEVDIRFSSAGPETRVDLEHRDFGRHGDSGETLRSGMNSPAGWPTILAEFRRACRRCAAK